MKILHDALNLSRSQSQILTAAGVPESLVGAALVIETGIQATQLASDVWPNSPIAEWHEAAKALRKTIRLANESGNLDAATLFQRPASELSIFSIISSWANFHVSSREHLAVLALLGRGWAINAHKSLALPESFVSGIRTLNNEHARRGKRSNDWKLLANADLSDIKEVKLLQQRISPVSKQSEFLLAVVRVLETDVAPANSTTFKKLDGQEESNSQFGSAQEKRSDTGNEFSEPANDSEIPHSKSVHLDTRRVAARLSAADYSSAHAKLGIDHRDHLLLKDLVVITRKLSVALATGSREERGFALFHLICLLTATSDLYALQIQLHPHLDHVWLDVEKGCWCWDFSAYRHAGKERPLPPLVEPVQVPMPLSVAQILKAECAGGAHNTVEELICSMQGVDIFALDRSREYLRQLGDPAHPPYRGRWSNSLAPAVLELTGSDMQAAFNTAQFAATAPAALFYFCPDYQTVYERLDSVLGHLQLGPVARPFETNAVMGKNRLPSMETIHRGWTRLVTDCENLVEKIEKSTTELEVIAHANKLMSLLAAAFVVHSAHRCQRFDQLTYCALVSQLCFLVIHDKNILDEASRSHPRLLAQTQQLKLIIANAVSCREQVLRKLSGRLTPPTTQTPVFASFIDDAHLRELPVLPADISNIIGSYFDGAASNFGRTLWITRLDEAGSDRWLTRTLSGHVRDITRTNGAFFDMPPATAATKLALCMNAMQTTLFGPSALASRPIPFLRLLPNHSRPRHTLTARQSKMAPHLILEPITADTLMAATLAEQVRKAIRNAKTLDLTFRSRLLLHLIFIDLLDGQAIAIPAVEAPGEWFTTDTPRLGLAWKRPHFVHSHWFPLSAESALLFQKTGLLPAKRRDLASEIQVFIGEVLSLSLDDDVLTQISDWARAFKRLYLPPALLASSTTYVESPCLNQASILRLSQSKELPVASEKLKKHFVRPRVKVSDDLERLGKKLNHFGDTDKRLGERRKRAVDALGDIAALPDAWSPCGLFLRDWIVEELERSRDNTMDRYEVSSLSTYFSRLKTAMDTRLGDPYDWEAEDWAEYITDLEVKFGNKDFTIGDVLSIGSQNALAALARSLIRRRYGIPTELWGYLNLSSREDPSRDSASAVLFTFDNLDVVEKTLEGTLGDFPPNLLRCLFRLKCGSVIPLRAGEFGGLKKVFITAGGAFAIERAGFNNIKNQQSVRVVLLQPADQQKIEWLAARLRDYVTAGDLLLRGTGHGADLEEDLRSSADFAFTLKLVAGDPKARPHSLRATTLQNLAWPDWQSILKGHLNCQLAAADLIEWTEGQNQSWLSTARAAAAAGQSGVASALHNYLAGWTLVYSLHASALTLKLPYSNDYAMSLGLSDDGYRQAKSRANRLAPSSFELSNWLQKKIRNREPVALKSPKVTVTKVALQRSRPHKTSTSSHRGTPSRRDEIEVDHESLRCLTMLALGRTSASLQNDLRLSSGLIDNLVSLLPPSSLIADCNKRARHGVEPRGLDAQLRLIDSDVGTQLIEWLMQLNARHWALSKYGLLWFLPEVPHSMDYQVDDWKQLAATIPSILAIRVHVGKNHLSKAEMHFEAQSNLAFKPERDLGSHHRISIHLKSDPDNRVQSARLTSVTQLLLLCLQSLRGATNA